MPKRIFPGTSSSLGIWLVMCSRPAPVFRAVFTYVLGEQIFPCWVSSETVKSLAAVRDRVDDALRRIGLQELDRGGEDMAQKSVFASTNGSYIGPHLPGMVS